MRAQPSETSGSIATSLALCVVAGLGLALSGCGEEPAATAAPAAAPPAPPATVSVPAEVACPSEGEGVRVEAERLVVEAPLSWNLYEGRLDDGACDAPLEALARRLLACREIEVEIQVHTDTMRMSSFNARSSQTVAEAIRARLVRAGVPEARLAACGYGESRPLEPGTSPASRARNNRAEFVRLGSPAAAHVCPPIE